MGEKIIVCDKCEHEFFTNAVSINERDVEVGRGEVITLFYFECPKCKTIYKICLKDSRYYSLVNDLTDAKARVRKLSGKCTEDIMSNLIASANAKKQRLANYVKMLDRKYPGVFTHSPINKEEIIYRENYTE